MSPRETLYTEIENEMDWLRTLLLQRAAEPLADLSGMISNPPALSGESSFGKTLIHSGLAPEERVIFALALAPHISPELPEIIVGENRFSASGGRKGMYHNGLLPTVQTALYLLGGESVSERGKYISLFRNDSPICRHDLLRISPPENGEPGSASLLEIPGYILEEIAGIPMKRDASWELIAAPEETQPLFLHSATEEKLNSLFSFLENNLPGITTLFSGKKGSGKRSAAIRLAARLKTGIVLADPDPYETLTSPASVKNLENVFRMASAKKMLVFIEAHEFLSSQSPDPQYSFILLSLLKKLSAYPETPVIVSCTGNISERLLNRISFDRKIVFAPLTMEMRDQLWKSIIPEDYIGAEGNSIRTDEAYFSFSPGELCTIADYAIRSMQERNATQLSSKDIGKALHLLSKSDS